MQDSAVHGEESVLVLAVYPDRKRAIIALTFIRFHHTNLTLVLGRILFTTHTYDLQRTGSGFRSEVHACLIMVI